MIKKITFIYFSIFFFQSIIIVKSQDLSVEVRAFKVQKKNLTDEIILNGTVNANEKVDITSVVSDKIKKIGFIEGSKVDKNKLLVQLENDEENALLNQVIAELEESNLNYDRAKKLVDDGNASIVMLDKRKKEKKKLEARKEEILAKLNDLKIKAPFKGVIGLRNFSVGSFINPGDIITTIYDLNKIKVIFFIPEFYLNSVFLSQKFIANFPALQDKEYSGKIFAINPLVDKNTRTFKVVGIINQEKEYDLRPGMMTNIKIIFNKRNSFLIPEGAIVPNDDKSYIFFVNENNIALKKLVKTGNRKNGYIEIINGIKENDLIIFEGTNKISNGTKINVRK